MFQHGSVATDKTRNVQFEPAMNQNSSTLQPDQFEHASARFEYQQLSKSPPMPLQVPKTALHYHTHIARIPLHHRLLESVIRDRNLTWSRCAIKMMCPTGGVSREHLGHGIDFLQADLRGFHASPSVPSCVPADVDHCFRESDHWRGGDRMWTKGQLLNLIEAYQHPMRFQKPSCLHAFMRSCRCGLLLASS